MQLQVQIHSLHVEHYQSSSRLVRNKTLIIKECDELFSNCGVKLAVCYEAG